MSKFFQISLKKEKNRLENVEKVKTDKLNTNIKKKNAKKFIMSPVKELQKDKHQNISCYNDESIEQNENTSNIKCEYEIEKNENKFSKPTLSCIYNNKHVSPLYTNTNIKSKNISSSLCYDTINNFNDYFNEHINTDVINGNNIYNTNIVENINNIDNIEKSNETNINYTSINKLNFTSLTTEPTLTYIQKDKFKLYNYNIMLDINSEKFLNNENKIPCYYCRRKFDFVALGIPIKFYPSTYVIIDNSLQTSKYSFNYKENIIRLNKSEKERIINILKKNKELILEKDCNVKEHNENKEHKIITKNFFETDGVFCSFNCIVSYIEENNYNPIYQNSHNLIYLMYKQIFGKYPSQPFMRSPSWKLRKEYGGPLDDDDYSKYIQSIPIVETKLINSIKNNIRPELTFEVLV